jgi:ribosomal protein L40E
VAWIALTGLTVSVLLLDLLAASSDGGESIFRGTLVGPLLLGAFVLALVAALGYKKERARQVGNRRPAPRAAVLRNVAAPQRAGAHKAHAGQGAVLSIDVDLPQRRPPVPVIRTPETKTCPTCAREFQTGLAVCPFDDTPLVAAVRHDEPAPASDSLDTRRAVMRCPSCEQEYDLGTRFCIYDGSELRMAEAEDASESFDGNLVCTECGAHHDSDATHCPDDGARLVPQHGHRSHAGYDAIPLLICPQCLSEFKAGQTRCPHDGRELLPLLGRTTGANPGTGLGAKTKFCERCGERYGEDAHYCRDDGQELISLN